MNTSHKLNKSYNAIRKIKKYKLVLPEFEDKK